MQTLATDVVLDSLTIIHVPADPEVLDLEPGAELNWDGQASTDHHIVVTRGTCRVLGRQLHPGASVYVPAGMAHTVRAGAWGCKVLSARTAHTEV